jgi:putative glutamine amidotransferase
MAEPRPLIAIPARFSASASALRYRAEVVAAALMECDGVPLPGGGDLAPHWSGQAAHPSLYDVDVRQDAFDFAVARVVLAGDLPLLAVCRGLHAVNVALGHSADGVIEAVDLPGRGGWFFGTQWHPEDTGRDDPALFEALVAAASAAVRPAPRTPPRGGPAGREPAG